MNSVLEDQKIKIRKAVYLGVLCAVAYLAVYIARNVLSAVAPETGFEEAFLGRASSLYFVAYAIGQLLNGLIGDKIKARNMISFGLLLAGLTNLTFMLLSEISPTAALAAYAATGFFLAMIYAPMTKVVSENTEPIYAVRCSLGYTFSSLFGSPVAGLLAAAFAWRTVFAVSSVSLFVMAALCFICFLFFEKRGYVKYHQYDRAAETAQGGAIGALVRRDILRFTVISFVTGVVRTSTVFWLTTYFVDYLGFSSDTAALLFTAVTLFISFSAFFAIFVYERFGRRMVSTTGVFFTVSAICFGIAYFAKIPYLNVVLIGLAIFFSNSAANIMWSVYCPSLRDTGKVSSATGYLDFVSYMAAALASSLFATAATTIGWGPLVLVWCALMVAGVLVCLIRRKKKYSEEDACEEVQHRN